MLNAKEQMCLLIFVLFLSTLTVSVAQINEYSSSSEETNIDPKIKASISFPTLNKDLFKNVLDAAKEINMRNSFVNIHLFNAGYIEMEKSWICNVKKFGHSILINTLFIATEQAAFKAIKDFSKIIVVPLNVVLYQHTAPSLLTYGENAYYSFMLFRTRVIEALLNSDITVWLTEADAVWRRDVTDVIWKHANDDSIDIAAPNDSSKIVGINMALLRPTIPTKRIWKKMQILFEDRIKTSMQNNAVLTEPDNELLSQLLAKDKTLNFIQLDPQVFTSGLWYNKNLSSFRSLIRNPAVIQNNWIVGGVNKVKRMKLWNHWFLDEAGKCRKTKVWTISEKNPLQKLKTVVKDEELAILGDQKTDECVKNKLPNCTNIVSPQKKESNSMPKVLSTLSGQKFKSFYFVDCYYLASNSKITNWTDDTRSWEQCASWAFQHHANWFVLHDSHPMTANNLARNTDIVGTCGFGGAYHTEGIAHPSECLLDDKNRHVGGIGIVAVYKVSKAKIKDDVLCMNETCSLEQKERQLTEISPFKWVDSNVRLLDGPRNFSTDFAYMLESGVKVAYRVPNIIRECLHCVYSHYDQTCNDSTILSIGVLSYDSLKRQEIRDTWGQLSCVFFIVGKKGGLWPEQEAMENRDIILIDIEEHYNILPYKTYLWFYLAHRWFPDAEYVIKTDEDCYVDTVAFNAELTRLKPDYFGSLSPDRKPIRDPNHKHYLSTESYGEDLLPKYAIGFGYALSRKARECLLSKVATQTHITIEDVAVGIIMKECGILLHSSAKFDLNNIAGTTRYPGYMFHYSFIDCFHHKSQKQVKYWAQQRMTTSECAKWAVLVHRSKWFVLEFPQALNDGRASCGTGGSYNKEGEARPKSLCVTNQYGDPIGGRNVFAVYSVNQTHGSVRPQQLLAPWVVKHTSSHSSDGLTLAVIHERLPSKKSFAKFTDSCSASFKFLDCYSHKSGKQIEAWANRIRKGITWRQCTEWAVGNGAHWFAYNFERHDFDHSREFMHATCGYGGSYDTDSNLSNLCSFKKKFIKWPRGVFAVYAISNDNENALSTFSMDSGKHSVTKQDIIMLKNWSSSPIVLEKYKLLIFTIPRTGCTLLRKLSRRIMGFENYLDGIDGEIPHNPQYNGLRYLNSYTTTQATNMMTSPSWTRAIFLREPQERLLSAYLKSNKTFAAKKCRRDSLTFEEFIYLRETCTDEHWNPLENYMDYHWWQYINFFGNLRTVALDTKRLLKKVGAWTEFGASGWYNMNKKLGWNKFEKDPKRISDAFAEGVNTNTREKLVQYYTPELWNAVNDKLYEPPFCYKTTEIQMIEDDVFETFSGSMRKYIGNDEYYVVDSNTKRNLSIKDIGDGRYRITCNDSNLKTISFTAILQYSCGVGKLSPPVKDKWIDAGALNTHFNGVITCKYDTKKENRNGMPSLRLNPIHLNKSKLYAIGDSMMNQFIFYDNKKPRYNSVQFKKIQYKLNLDTYDTYLAEIFEILPHNADSILLLNSGLWDLLDDYFDPYFYNHEIALDKLIRTIKAEFPNTRVIWKGMTAVHIHRVDCGCIFECLKRVKYMSSSRASQIEVIQKKIVDRYNITYIPQYDFTYTSADKCRPNDGRHYTEDMNNILWDKAFNNRDPKDG